MSPAVSRMWASSSEPHRDLIRLRENVQRGNDVRRLEGAARLRLEARDLHHGRTIGRDGILTPAEFDAFEVAARYLGALESALRAEDVYGRPILTVGVQRLVVDPGSRSPEQLTRARERMAALEQQRRDRDRDRPLEHGISAAQRREVRDRFEDAMRLGLGHAATVHYTQGVRRWDGIRLGLRSAEGQFPRYADCSSYTTWALWNALTGALGMDYPDVVNGSGWAAGFTGTQASHGRVVSLDALEVGDLVLYGNAFPYGHVAGYVGGGKVISHGSEGGPYLLPVRYRGARASHGRRYF